MNRTVRKFCALLMCAALAIAIANMACGSTIEVLDTMDEGQGAT